MVGLISFAANLLHAAREALVVRFHQASFRPQARAMARTTIPPALELPDTPSAVTSRRVQRPGIRSVYPTNDEIFPVLFTKIEQRRLLDIG